MPSNALPISIGSSGKAPTKSVSVTALRSAPDSFTGTSAALILHSGSGLTTTAVSNSTYGGAGIGEDTLESKITNLDASVRRKKVYSATLGPTTGPNGYEADYIESAGLTAIFNKTADPLTASQNTLQGLSVAVRYATYATALASWSAKVSLFGVMRGVSRPVINYTGAADMTSSSFASDTGFEHVENMRFGCTSTGRWGFGRTSNLNNNLVSAENCEFQGVKIVQAYEDMFFTRCLFAASSTLTSNYTVEIQTATYGELVFRDCHFYDISSNAASAAAGAILYLHTMSNFNGTILFDNCYFDLFNDTSAILEISNCTKAKIVFRNCHFAVRTNRVASARHLIIANNSVGFQFQDCTMVMAGPAMSITNCGCVIDGFDIFDAEAGDATVDPTYFLFSGLAEGFGTDEHAWVDIRSMDISVVGRDSANACFEIQDFVEGGNIKLKLRQTPWGGTGNFFRIDRAGTTAHQIAVFNQIIIDCGGEANSNNAGPLVHITGDGTASDKENNPQVQIDVLVLRSLESVTNRTYVELNNSVHLGLLSLEDDGPSNAARNDIEILTVIGNDVHIQKLNIDSSGDALDPEDSTSIVTISGARCRISGGYYNRDTSFSSEVGIFHITGDFCEIRNFHCILSYSNANLSEGVFYVRADGFVLSNCLLYADSLFGGTVPFLDLDGLAASIDHNLFRSSGGNYANIAGDGHVINGNRFSGQSAPTINVTATNCAPAVLSDTNVFQAQLSFPVPVTET